MSSYQAAGNHCKIETENCHVSPVLVWRPPASDGERNTLAAYNLKPRCDTACRLLIGITASDRVRLGEELQMVTGDFWVKAVPSSLRFDPVHNRSADTLLATHYRR